MRSSTLLPLLSSVAVADFLGPRFPYPTDISSNSSRIPLHWRTLTSSLDELVAPNATSELAELRDITFSVGIFSPRDPGAACNPNVQYHHTSPEVANSTYGTNRVNGDSMYRVASITKMITMLAGLLNLNSTDWERPITDFFPQLAEPVASSGLVNHIQWERVTLFSLASQLSGIPRDAFGLNLAEVKANVDIDPYSLGFPPLPQDDPLVASICDFEADPECVYDIDNFIRIIQERPPNFLPWTSPAYANNNYILLGEALQNITGREINQLMRESIFDPLGMPNSRANTPPEGEMSIYVIPGDEESFTSFATDAPAYARSSGGVLSSIHELAQLGVGILNHTLLSREETNKWMKPQTHTDRLTVSIGAPWEIFRHQHANTSVVTDIYCKSGDSGITSSWFCLLPDFEVGFTILAAASTASRTRLVGIVGDMVVDALMAALPEQTILETARSFAGEYTSPVEGLNSSMIFTINTTWGAAPGLQIQEFISNGTDVLSLDAMQTYLPGDRLMPVITDATNRQVAFRAVPYPDLPSEPLGRLSDLSFLGWVAPGQATYGNMDTSLFVFDVDSSGRATAVTPAAWRTTLTRSE